MWGRRAQRRRLAPETARLKGPHGTCLSPTDQPHQRRGSGAFQPRSARWVPPHHCGRGGTQMPLGSWLRASRMTRTASATRRSGPHFSCGRALARAQEKRELTPALWRARQLTMRGTPRGLGGDQASGGSAKPRISRIDFAALCRRPLTLRRIGDGGHGFTRSALCADAAGKGNDRNLSFEAACAAKGERLDCTGRHLPRG